MHFILTVSLLGLVALALQRVLSILIEKRRDAARAKEWGCGEVPKYPSGFMGMKNLREMQEADKEMQFPALMERNMAKMTAQTGRLCTTWESSVLGTRSLITSDPENIKAMLATQFAEFELGEARAGNFMPTLGDGIFLQDGKKWEHSRGLLRPNFIRDQISDLDLEERHLQELLQVMPVHENGWTAETNIQKLFFQFTIDSATEFLFGESVNSLRNTVGQSKDGASSDDIVEAFPWNFDNAQKHLAHRIRFGDKYWLHNPKEFKENNRVVKQFAMSVINRVLSKTPQQLAEEKGDRYVFLEELARQTRDPEELFAQLMNILLAGRDTTASLLSWVFHLLLRDPRVFAELRKTIIETFGTYENPRDISFATLKSCQYLQHTLNETLRLHTVVPGNGRRSNKPTTLPRGGGPDGTLPVYIPTGTDVAYSVHVMMRRKDLWGEDADQFRPERFIGRRPGWEYLPFNGGPRICIGQQFALTEASYVIVRLLQKFDSIKARPEELEEAVRYNLTLTNCPGRPVTLWLREAKED